MNETDLSQLVVPLDWGNQVVPPSVVRMIVPDPPTAVPVIAVRKSTSFKSITVGLVCPIHDEPPSVVLPINPYTPTV